LKTLYKQGTFAYIGTLRKAGLEKFESPILRKNADGASFKGAPSAFTEIARIR
jgi:hypothetical protein